MKKQLPGVREAEKAALKSALEANGWSPNRAAKALGISLHGVQGLLKRHPEIKELVKERGPGPGRPPKAKKRRTLKLVR